MTKLLLINYKWKLILRICFFFNHLSDTNKAQTMTAFLLRVSGLTMLRAEKFLMGSSAARETELSMMKTRMRLVNMWWLMSLWQNTRTLRGRGQALKRTRRVEMNWLQSVSTSYGLVLLKIKKALPSGMGVIFSFFTRSEMTGRGPDGTSGSSSSPAVSSLSSSSSWGQAETVRGL